MNANQCSSPLLDNSSTTPTDGNLPALTRSTPTKTTSEPSNNFEDLPAARGETLDTTLIIGIAIGCFMVLLFIVTVAIAVWSCLCFKARAIRKQSKKGLERNSQLFYEVIPEGLHSSMAPPTGDVRVQLQHARDQQQRINTTPSTNYNTGATDLVTNPAYRGSNLAHTGRIPQQEITVNMEQNPAYHSNQERLH